MQDNTPNIGMTQAGQQLGGQQDSCSSTSSSSN